MQSRTRQWIYGVLAVVGIGATMYYNLAFMEQHGGFGVVLFVSESYATAASSSISNDLAVAVFAFFVFLFVEARRLEMRFAWVYFLLTFGIAFAFSFPLFLLMRERRLDQLAGSPA